MATKHANSVSADGVPVTVWEDDLGEFYITPSDSPRQPVTTRATGLVRRYLSAAAAYRACQSLYVKGGEGMPTSGLREGATRGEGG